MEFQIITDLSALPQTIDFNFEAMKAELDTKLEHYRNLVVTEDSIKGAKEDRAALNKLSAAIDARRKEIKAQCLAPYSDFEVKCKELTGMIGQASRSIDQQVKAFEEQEKQEKRQAIEAVYPELAGKLSQFIPFSKLMDQKWLNKTVSVNSAITALSGRVDSIRRDIDTICNMHLTHEVPVLARYYETLDLSAAMNENLRLSKLDLARDQQKEPVQDPEPPAAPNVSHVQATAPVSEPEPPEEPKTIKVIFYDTTADFRAEMRALTDKYGVKYGGIR